MHKTSIYCTCPHVIDVIKGKLDKHTHPACPFSAVNGAREIKVQILSCHLSTGASDFCLCSSTGGVAPLLPSNIKTTLPAVSRLLPRVSDVGHCQISQEGLKAVCLHCKLKRRERGQKKIRNKGCAWDREKEGDYRFKELMNCLGGGQ